MITQTRLKELLSYDSLSGEFTWLVQRGKHKAGRKATTLRNGYIVIKIDGVNYDAHRLVFLYEYGSLPKECVDHINRVRTDNRLCNLRECSKLENAQNKSKQRTNNSGVIGVWWNKQSQKWQAGINHNNIKIYLGLFATRDEASLAYQNAKLSYHLFHPQTIA